MFGAVFQHELLRAGRRTRVPFLARVYSAWLLVQFTTLAAAHWAAQPASGLPAAAALADFVRGFVRFFVVQHFALVVLVTPTLAAAALADEQGRGTLSVLLATPLSGAVIVGAKLLARFIEAATLALVGLPLLCLVAGIGHLGAGFVVSVLALTLALVLAVAALTILVSVWRQGRKATLLTTYAILAVVAGGLASAHLILAPSLVTRWKARLVWVDIVSRADAILACASPLFVLEPAWERPQSVDLAARLQAGTAGYAVFAGLCTTLAAWRLRPAFRRAGEGTSRSHGWRAARRTRRLRGDPVYWRERLGERPSRRAAAALMALALGWLAASGASRLGAAEAFLAAGVGGLALGGLAVAVRASGSISGERERRTWEVILLTDVPTDELTTEKARAAVHSSRLYVAAYALPVLAVAVGQGRLESIVVLLTFVMTWAALDFMAANSVWWSASSRSSWQSLLGSVATGYAFCFGIAGLLSFLAVGAGCALGPAILFFLIVLGSDTAYAAALVGVVALTAAGAVWLLRQAAHAQIAKADYWIDSQERAGKTLVRVLARALAGGTPLLPPTPVARAPDWSRRAVTR